MSAIQPASAYADLAAIRSGVPAVRVARKTRSAAHREWLQRELRAGGYFDRYVRKEQHRMNRSIRTVARAFHDARPKRWADVPKPLKDMDGEMAFALPARLYFRLKAMDPHFFDDPQNLKNLKRDNPELCIWP